MRIAALDLGSGTIKLSVFEKTESAWTALCLEETNTELRKGMGPDRRLQPEPIAATLAAVAAFVKRAQGFGIKKVPAYGTSAVRKASNAQDLTGPLLRRFDVATRIFTEEDEGRMNLLGALTRAQAPALGAGLGAVPAPRSKLSVYEGMLVMDPGGDSSEICAGEDWKTAPVASLPFGSVSLQEKFGSKHDNEPIAWERLQAVAADTKAVVLAYGPAQPFIGQPWLPAIRMNVPIQRALEISNSLPQAAHGQGGTYSIAHLEALTKAVAARDHAGRAALMDGEPLGKIDRTCYGFASWLGALDALGAETFTIEPWGIKLGAALYLNGEAV